MGLFRKIPNDLSRSTQFIIIRHISTNFETPFDCPAPDARQSNIQNPTSNIRDGYRYDR
jgi:hypothetical protein